MIRAKAPRPALGFTVTLDARPVGFVKVNVFGRSHSTSHFHLVDPGLRRTRPMSTVLRAGLPAILRAVREDSGAEGVWIEVRTRNVGMNRVLQRLGYPILETRDLDDPDGLAGPGRFHIYELAGPETGRQACR